MQLQQRYNEGVQRSQSYIDSIAGLQVAGDANKEYLQGKVQQMEGKVTKLASSDFAKNSVSAQVGQLASQVYRDPVVQAGVQSAVRIGKYQKSWEDLQKDHPDQYSEQDKTYYDAHYLSPFLEEGKTKAGITYNGPTDAHAHINYYDKLSAELQKLSPSITTSMSPNGQFNYTVDKNSVVPKAQIEGVINSYLSSNPQIGQQMQIDSWNTYRSFDNKGMYDHINDAYNSQIQAHTDIATKWQDYIKAHPGDYGRVTQFQQNILDSNDEVKRLQNQRDIYLKGINGGNLDQVKYSVFSDNIRNGLVLAHAKNNVDTELKTNQGAVEAMRFHFDDLRSTLEWAKEGLDVKTGRSLIPGDPMYAAWRAMQDNKRKRTRGTGVNGDDGDDEVQHVAMPGLVPDTYTEAENTKRQVQLGAQVAGLQGKLRAQLGMEDKKTDPEWNRYMATQEAKWNAGDPNTDQNFKDYKKMQQQFSALANTYADISEGVHAKSAAENNIDDNLPNEASFHTEVPLSGGGSHTRVVTADKGAIKIAMAINQRANDEITKRYPIIPGQAAYASQKGPSDAEVEQIWNQAAGAYNGNDTYRKHAVDILGIAKSRDLNKYLETNEKVTQATIASTDNKFAEFGRTTSYTATPFTGKADDYKYYKNVIASSLPSSPNSEAVNVDDIDPISFFNDEEGKLNINYQTKKDKKWHTIPIPAGQNIMGDPDPNQWVNRIIDISPTHSTPLDPDKALSSDNGRLKYALQKNQLTGKTNLIIWNKGARYTVPDTQNYQNMGSFMERVNQLAEMPPDKIEEFMKGTFTKQ